LCKKKVVRGEVAVEVVVIFDPAFQGQVGSAVWIVDTPENRAWFAAQAGRDANSAVFSVDGYGTVDDAVAPMIWNAQEHYPRWEQIRVIGTVLTPMIVTALKDEGVISSMLDGFLLQRAAAY
jgi:hypothetical protein